MLGDLCVPSRRCANRRIFGVYPASRFSGPCRKKTECPRQPSGNFEMCEPIPTDLIAKAKLPTWQQGRVAAWTSAPWASAKLRAQPQYIFNHEGTQQFALKAAWIQTRLSTAWARFFLHLLMLPLLCHVFFTLRTVSRPVSGASGALPQSLCQTDVGATGSAMEIAGFCTMKKTICSGSHPARLSFCFACALGLFSENGFWR